MATQKGSFRGNDWPKGALRQGRPHGLASTGNDCKTVAQRAILRATMHRKRVFKTRKFANWAKKVVADSLLCIAAREIEQGIYEADLGGGVCKKRIALPGKGKSGSTRTLVAKQHRTAIFFLAGREKGDPGKDFSSTEESLALMTARALHALSDSKLAQAVADGNIKEICNEQQDAETQPRGA